MSVEQVLWSVERRVEHARVLVKLGCVRSAACRSLNQQLRTGIIVRDCAVHSGLL